MLTKTFLLLHLFQASSGDIFDFINTKLGGKKGEIFSSMIYYFIRVKNSEGQIFRAH